MSDITYRLYAKADGHREYVIEQSINAFRTTNYHGGIAVYRNANSTLEAFPDAVYAPGQWTRLVKNEEER